LFHPSFVLSGESGRGKHVNKLARRRAEDFAFAVNDGYVAHEYAFRKV
jgi:hypothetical protein